jgi:hypothetical protein
MTTKFPAIIKPGRSSQSSQNQTGSQLKSAATFTASLQDPFNKKIIKMLQFQETGM